MADAVDGPELPGQPGPAVRADGAGQLDVAEPEPAGEAFQGAVGEFDRALEPGVADGAGQVQVGLEAARHAVDRRDQQGQDVEIGQFGPQAAADRRVAAVFDRGDVEVEFDAALAGHRQVRVAGGQHAPGQFEADASRAGLERDVRVLDITQHAG